MQTMRQGLLLFLLATAGAAWAQSLAAPQAERRVAIDPQAWRLVLLANQARNDKGAGTLWWDPALAASALEHCQRMVAEGQIAHRYGGEEGLTERAARAGAHFSLIEENIAVGASPATIHQGWMDSPDHRDNLMNPKVDRVGIAVVASRGVLYAVADYAQAVKVRTTAEVEDAVGSLLRARGLIVVPETMEARAYCAHSRELNGILGNNQPTFAMEWQNSDPTQLPKSLEERLTPGLRKAAVGSCAPLDVEGAFTVYRVAVLLY